MDECFGRYRFVEAVRQSGVPVIAHHEVFGAGVSDEEWLRFAAREGYIALAKDEKIRSNLLAIETILASRARS